jgi:hypothetical protein
MPCYRCGMRQVDPDRGESPWTRGVLHDHQVLICPKCRTSRDWATELDRCGRCDSAHMVRRLDEVECRDCGLIRLADADHGHGAPAGLAAAAVGRPDPNLAEEVGRALAKVLGRTSDTRRRRSPAATGQPPW